MRLATLAIGSFLSIACSQDTNDHVEAPYIGKADGLQGVVDRGALLLDKSSVAEITRDFQFDGYHLKVGKPSTISIETTHLGSSAGFDTTLFVYGPQAPIDGFGDTFAFMDNDSGFGALSKLEALDLEAGEYRIVVGTPDALGRGRYRLLATCESGDCGDQAQALTDAERDLVLDALNFDCVFQSCTGDFGWSAGNVECDFESETCGVAFTVNLSDFDVEQSDFEGEVGLSESRTSSSGKGFSATLTAVDTDQEGVLLDYRCRLDGYDSAAQILEPNGGLRGDFESHVLDCVFLIEDLTHGLL